MNATRNKKVIPIWDIRTICHRGINMIQINPGHFYADSIILKYKRLKFIKLYELFSINNKIYI